MESAPGRFLPGRWWRDGTFAARGSDERAPRRAVKDLKDVVSLSRLALPTRDRCYAIRG